MSPALALALVALTQVQAVKAVAVGTKSGGVALASGCMVSVAAQRGEDYSFGVDLCGTVVLGVVLLALCLWVWLVGVSQGGVVEEVEQDSPRHRREKPSSSWEGNSMGSGQSSQGPEPVDESVRTPRRPMPTSEDLESREVCVFPLIGRLDPRSNWVPHHYLRGLLSLVGGRMFQYLGCTVWRFGG